MRCLAFMGTLCSVASISCGLWRETERPASVPNGAVEVMFSKDGGWAYCWLDYENALNRCRTFTWRGNRLYRPGRDNDPDDVFLLYRGDGPVPEAELQIDPSRTEIDFVWLRTGIVLLPRNDFENQKAFIDKLMALPDTTHPSN